MTSNWTVIKLECLNYLVLGRHLDTKATKTLNTLYEERHRESTKLKSHAHECFFLKAGTRTTYISYCMGTKPEIYKQGKKKKKEKKKLNSLFKYDLAVLFSASQNCTYLKKSITNLHFVTFKTIKNNKNILKSSISTDCLFPSPRSVTHPTQKHLKILSVWEGCYGIGALLILTVLTCRYMMATVRHAEWDPDQNHVLYLNLLSFGFHTSRPEVCMNYPKAIIPNSLLPQSQEKGIETQTGRQ